MTNYGQTVYGGSLYGGTTQETVPLDVQDKRGDFQTILDENGQTVSLVKEDEQLDNYGGVIGTTDTTVFVECHIQPRNEKQRELLNVGEHNKGDAVGYFKHETRSGQTDYIIDTGDKIIQGIDDTEQKERTWRVESVEGRYTILGHEIYRKVALNRVENG
jgi:hypothetical protein